MLKLQYLLIYWGILCPLFLFAQSTNVRYKISSPYKIVKHLDFEFFSNKELDVTVCYKINYGKITIQSYDTKSMKVLASNTLEHYILNLLWVKDKLYGFYEFKASETSTSYVYAREIDYKTCEFKGKTIKLFSADKMIYQVASIIKFEDVRIKQSKDKNKTLVYILQNEESLPNGAITSSSVSLLTLDENFEKIAFHKYKMPNPEQEIGDRTFMIDNNGIPYMIYKVYNDNKTKIKRSNVAKEKNNYTINLFKFSLEEKDYSKITIPFKESFLVRNFSLFQGKDNELIIAGYYNIDKDNKGVFKSQNVDGGFFTSVNSDLEISTIKTYPIKEEFIFRYTEFWKKFSTSKRINKIPPELKDLVIRDLIIEEDNSITIIGEQYYMSTYTSTNQFGQESTQKRFYYDNVIISKLDKNGNIIWMTKIPKKMKGTIYMSTPGYIYTNVDENHYFFIHEDRDNEVLDDNGEIIRERTEHHGNFSLFKVNSNTGKLSKHIIFDMMDVKGVKTYNLRMDRLMWISDNEFVLECYKKKKEDIMIKVEIN